MKTVKITPVQLGNAIAEIQGFIRMPAEEWVNDWPYGPWKNRDGEIPSYGLRPDYLGSMNAAMSLLPSGDGERVVLSRIRANSRSPWRGQMIWHCSFTDCLTTEHLELPVAICLAAYQKAKNEIVELVKES